MRVTPTLARSYLVTPLPNVDWLKPESIAGGVTFPMGRREYCPVTTYKYQVCIMGCKRLPPIFIFAPPSQRALAWIERAPSDAPAFSASPCLQTRPSFRLGNHHRPRLIGSATSAGDGQPLSFFVCYHHHRWFPPPTISPLARSIGMGNLPNVTIPFTDVKAMQTRFGKSSWFLNGQWFIRIQMQESQLHKRTGAAPRCGLILKSGKVLKGGARWTDE